ncbi:MAG: MarR family winged helix-turn-helix transcriptional regulator [Pseudomonadota bacterium]
MTQSNGSDAPLPLHRFLTYRMARVQSKLNTQASRLLRAKAGLSLAQWRILALIGSNPGARSTDLTRISAMDKGQFSRKLKTLVDDRLVTVTMAAEDHRTMKLELSESGQALFERTLPHMRERQMALSSLLAPEEEEMFFRVLDRLETAVEDEAAGGGGR